MRWLRRTTSQRPPERDSGRPDALVQEIRHRFGADVRIQHDDQVKELVALLDGDDGMDVATGVVHDVAEEAHAEVLAQVADLDRRTGRRYALDGRSYGPLWRLAGADLRFPLFELPCGFHPYIHLPAALAVVGLHPRRCLQVVDPVLLLTQVFGLLELVAAGWEFGRVRVDADAANLAGHLISAPTQVRAAMKEPPPLPPAIRERMRSNHTTAICDATGSTAIGDINLGAQMRQAFLT
jgi:hypothetical protein